MAAKRGARPRQKRDSSFYEYMPGTYMQSYEIFPTNVESKQDEPDVTVRRRMIRQFAVLVALLVVQLILFAILLKSTVNLG